MEQKFDEVITTRARLREVLGEPRGYSPLKSTDRIDGILSRFIAASPYLHPPFFWW